MIVHTSRLFDTRAAELGPLDVTRKSGKEGLIWAPSWQILKPALKAFKQATTAEQREHAFADYAAVYRNEMARSCVARRDQWQKLLRWEYPSLELEREHLTLQCYCIDAKYCHRTLLGRDILPGACRRLGIGYEFSGEL